MEAQIVLAENSLDSSNEKKVTKRRSSLFQRQSIVPQEQDLDSTSTSEVIHECKKLKLLTKSDQESFDVKKYIEQLEYEDKKWREEYAKRKICGRDLKLKQEQNPDGLALDPSCLSDSERAFLAARPNYEQFNKNLFQLQAMATKVTYFGLCNANFHEKITLKTQNQLNNARDRIIQLID